MSIITAKNSFKENIQLTGGAARNPESFNLYNGLYNLARAIEDIEIRLKKVETAVTRLARRG